MWTGLPTSSSGAADRHTHSSSPKLVFVAGSQVITLYCYLGKYTLNCGFTAAQINATALWTINDVQRRRLDLIVVGTVGIYWILTYTLTVGHGGSISVN